MEPQPISMYRLDFLGNKTIKIFFILILKWSRGMGATHYGN
jgi:hypothetical protein